MPRVKSSRRKPEYIKTILRRRAGDPVDCHHCGYTGKADLIESTALASGYLERCPQCRSKNFSYKEPVMPWITDEWKGCYPSSWKGLISQSSMSHPAKFSSKLIRRIYEHLRAEKWVKEGDKIIDPFGGVGLGSLDAMRLGLEWFGVELEAKFVELGIGMDCPGLNKKEWIRWQGRLSKNKNICPDCRLGNGLDYKGDGKIPTKEIHRFHGNIDNWNIKFHTMPNWGRAVLCQGDSRKLLQVLRGNSGAAAMISSPPYAETDLGGGAGILARDATMRETHGMTTENHNYGKEEGNLGNMRGDNFEASISSPPYAQTDIQYKRNGLKENGKEKYERPYMEGQGDQNYGSTDGQLGDMKAENFDASISSPPFADSLSRDYLDPSARREAARARGMDNVEHLSPIEMEKLGQRDQGDYGSTPGQLSNMPAGDFNAAGNSAAEGYGGSDGQLANDDFWMAARQIVEQVYLALAPGGHAVWVTKRFVKNKQIVEFSDQWRQLCEAVGFRTVHWHRALLVRENGKSHTLEGNTVEHKTESKSFFRRLAEKKGSPRIDWEDVLCMVKD